MRAASERLAPFGARATVVRNNFCRLAEVCAGLGIERIDGVLLDQGVSSYQLDTPERGILLHGGCPVGYADGRSRGTDGVRCGEHVLRGGSAAHPVFIRRGALRRAHRGTHRVRARRSPHRNNGELSELIKAAIPAAAREGGHHPAKRSFQSYPHRGKRRVGRHPPRTGGSNRPSEPRRTDGGYHLPLAGGSDRQGHLCGAGTGLHMPLDLPVCVCGRKPRVRPVSRKPILPSAEELEDNPAPAVPSCGWRKNCKACRRQAGIPGYATADMQEYPEPIPAERS